MKYFLSPLISIGSLLLITCSGCVHRVQVVDKSVDQCATNLTKIWWGLEKWLDDGDKFPPTLARLAEVGCTPDIFICPTSNHRTGELSTLHEWADFIYVAGEEEGDDLEIAILISPPENHKGLFGLVMWKGGYTAKVSPDQATNLIREPWCMVKNIQRADVQSLRKRLNVLVPSRWQSHYPDAFRAEVHKP